jgi:PPE-repeat protein
MPSFPKIDPPIQREDAVNQILSSIAMEELGLSHILNAEGEKLQYILGTIPGLSGPPATVSDVLAANESVRSMLETAVQNQLFLKSKMQGALAAAPMQGPTGPTGPTIYTQRRNHLINLQRIKRNHFPSITFLKQEAILLPAFLCPKGDSDHAGNHIVRLFLRR